MGQSTGPGAARAIPIYAQGARTARRRMLTVAAALANWQLNEAAGARTMVDSSGNALNGTIGTHVQTGIALSGGGTGYRFPYIRPNTPPADPEHLVVVPPQHPAQPGQRQLRRRVPDAHHPLVRQHHPEGPGRVQGRLLQVPAAQREGLCLFRGSAGSSTASTGSTVRVNDGNWHTVRCERTPSSVTMYIDGQRTGRNTTHRHHRQHPPPDHRRQRQLRPDRDHLRLLLRRPRLRADRDLLAGPFRAAPGRCARGRLASRARLR
jgi:hypothetical protein